MPQSADFQDTRRRHVVLGALCVLASCAYLSRNSLSLLAADPSFLDELRLTRDDVSYVMSTFLLSYAVCQIPVGWIGQRLGSRLVLPACVMVWSVATGCLGLAGYAVAGAVAPLTVLLVVMSVNGVAQAGAFPNAARTIADWMPTRQRAFSSGLLAAFMSLGGAMTASLTGWLTDLEVPWRIIVLGYAVPGLCWGVGFLVWFRDRPEQHAGVSDEELRRIRDDGATNVTHDEVDSEPDIADVGLSSGSGAGSRPARASLLTIVSHPALWLINAQQFFRAAGYIFFGTWFPTWLKETRGLTQTEAGLLTSLPLLATVAGCVVGGWLSDELYRRTASRTISRRVVAAVCLLLCSGLTLLAMRAETTQQAIALITCGAFLAAVAGPSSYAQTIDMAGPHVPVVFGMMNMVGNLGAAACPIAVTWFVSMNESWSGLLVMFAAIYLAAAVCWMLLDADARIAEAG